MERKQLNLVERQSRGFKQFVQYELNQLEQEIIREKYRVPYSQEPSFQLCQSNFISPNVSFQVAEDEQMVNKKVSQPSSRGQDAIYNLPKIRSQKNISIRRQMSKDLHQQSERSQIQSQSSKRINSYAPEKSQKSSLIPKYSVQMQQLNQILKAHKKGQQVARDQLYEIQNAVLSPTDKLSVLSPQNESKINSLNLNFIDQNTSRNIPETERGISRQRAISQKRLHRNQRNAKSRISLGMEELTSLKQNTPTALVPATLQSSRTSHFNISEVNNLEDQSMISQQNLQAKNGFLPIEIFDPNPDSPNTKQLLQQGPQEGYSR